MIIVTYQARLLIGPQFRAHPFGDGACDRRAFWVNQSECRDIGAAIAEFLQIDCLQVLRTENIDNSLIFR